MQYYYVIMLSNTKYCKCKMLSKLSHFRSKNEYAGELSPRNKEQIKMLSENSTLKQTDIANKLNVSPCAVGRIKEKLRDGEDLEAKRVGKCGKNRKPPPDLIKKIVTMSLSDRRSSCRKISSVLASQGLIVYRRTFNRRLCEVGQKAYRPRKKLRLTKKMKACRRAWTEQHSDCTA